MRTYFASAGLARLADEMVGLSIILLIYERTHDSTLSGLAVAAYTLPSILSGPLLGAWLDRTRRPLVALAGNQFVLAVMMIGLIWAVGRAPAFAVLRFAFVAGITLPMTSGGFTSLVPRLVQASELPRATSMDAMLFNAAAIGGPALAAVLAPLFGATSAMAVIEVGCIASVLVLRGHLHRWRPERTVFTAVALYGLALATWPLTTSFAVLLALALLSGLAEGPTLTAVITARQRYTPTTLLGQVSTTGASLKIGGFALGAALGGVLITTTPPTAVILYVAAAQLAAALLGLLATRTRSEQPPNQAYGATPTPPETVGPTRQA